MDYDIFLLLDFCMHFYCVVCAPSWIFFYLIASKEKFVIFRSARVFPLFLGLISLPLYHINDFLMN